MKAIMDRKNQKNLNLSIEKFYFLEGVTHCPLHKIRYPRHCPWRCSKLLLLQIESILCNYYYIDVHVFSFFAVRLRLARNRFIFYFLEPWLSICRPLLGYVAVVVSFFVSIFYFFISLGKSIDWNCFVHHYLFTEDCRFLLLLAFKKFSFFLVFCHHFFFFHFIYPLSFSYFAPLGKG